MKTLVTGATGFVGSAVIRRLVQAGHEVCALVRPQSDRRNLEGVDAEVRVGDLTDRASLDAAVKGCGALFHVAAEYRIWHPRPKEMERANVEGTRNILEAARDAGIERAVYTSSVATLGLLPDGRAADEETPSPLESVIGAYKRSKHRAEDVARELAKDFAVVIVNPAAPVGPRDIKPTPTGRMILDAAAGRMPAYVDTGLSVVHVDDVADGHLRAFEKGKSGERYILGGENLSLREILVKIAKITGGQGPKIRLAPGLLIPFAYLAQGVARITGGSEPRMTVDGLRMSRKKMYFRSDKANRELGFRARPAHEAIFDAVAWFREAGMLSARGAGKLEGPIG